MKKKLLWAVVSLLIAGLTIWAVASQSRSFSPADLWREIKDAHKGWLILALVFGYIFFEGMAVIRVADRLGYRRSPAKGCVYGAADVYFSAITPSATGGQPVCAWFMIRDKIPTATTTVTLLITLVMYTLSLLLSGIFAMLFFFPMFLAFSPLAKVMILLGAAILLVLGLFFLMLLRKPRILNRICNAFLHLLEKIRLVRAAERLQSRLDVVMEEYELCSRMLLGKGRVLLESFFWNLCQRLSYYLVPFAMAPKMFAMQSNVVLGACCVPIPGAMGAADYMLLDGFGQLMSEDAAITMEMLCRGVTFYGSVSTGLLIVIIGYLAGRKRNTK